MYSQLTRKEEESEKFGETSIADKHFMQLNRFKELARDGRLDGLIS